MCDVIYFQLVTLHFSLIYYPMVTLHDIQNDLQTAMKNRDQLTMDTLRGLKARVEKEHIALARVLTDEEMGKLLQSELKRRQEAGEMYRSGNRVELALKEDEEANIIARYLPAQASEADIAAAVLALRAQHGWQQADFGAAMKILKEQFGATADGAMLSKILKDKLNS